MLNSYILLYQYFDLQEMKLLEEIQCIQSRVIYRDPRNLTSEESFDLAIAKVKLDFVRKISKDLLQMFLDIGKIE